MHANLEVFFPPFLASCVPPLLAFSMLPSSLLILPDELLCEVLGWLNAPRDLLAISCVNSRLQRTLRADNDCFWKNLCEQRWPLRYSELPGLGRAFYLARARTVPPTSVSPTISVTPATIGDLYLIVEAESIAEIPSLHLHNAQQLAKVLPFAEAYSGRTDHDYEFEWPADLNPLGGPTLTLANQHPERMSIVNANGAHKSIAERGVTCRETIKFVALWHAPTQLMCILVREGELLGVDGGIRNDGITYAWYSVNMCAPLDSDISVGNWQVRKSPAFWRTADARLRQYVTNEMRLAYHLADDVHMDEPPVRCDVSFRTGWYKTMHAATKAELPSKFSEGRINFGLSTEYINYYENGQLLDDEVTDIMSRMPWE